MAEGMKDNCNGLSKWPKYYDDEICSILKKEELDIEAVSGHFLVKCLQYGLNDTVLYIIAKDPGEVKSQFSLLSESPLVLDDLKASEGVVLKVLDVCQHQIATHIKDVNSTGENLLQILSRIGYSTAVKHFIDNFHDVLKRSFDVEQFALVNAIPHDGFDEDSLIDIWCKMINANHPKFVDIIKTNAVSDQNIFYQCATHHKYKLFRRIADNIWANDELLAKAIKFALFQCRSDGRAPFHILKDEFTIMSILNTFSEFKNKENTIVKSFGESLEHFIKEPTKKNNNSLNIFAKKGFKHVIEWIMNFMKPSDIKDLLLHTNNVRNNAPMVCVVYNQGEILKTFLMWLFSTQHCTKEEIYEFLHQRNTYGETILSLVLQHENTMLVPQYLLLDKEREYHKEETKEKTMFKLTSCLKKNDLRSGELVTTIKRVDDSHEKHSKWEVFKMILHIVATAFVVPIMIQGFDMWFDGWVVIRYGNLLAEEEKNKERLTRSLLQHEFEQPEPIHHNETQPLCHIEDFQTLLSYPEALSYWPIFNYSLSFIVIPWIFYLIEFFLSRYFKEIKNEVCSSKTYERKFEML